MAKKTPRRRRSGSSRPSLSEQRRRRAEREQLSERRGNDALVARARQIFADRLGVQAEEIRDITPYGLCPYWAWAIITAAKEQGRRLVLQAGSAGWRFMPPHLDDGIGATHFSYEWQGSNPTNRIAMAAGLMPEMHVWAADPAAQELIDLATFDWPDQAERLLGAKWLDKRPPDYLWASPGQLPEQAYYRPDRDATMLAGRMLMQVGLSPEGGLR